MEVDQPRRGDVYLISLDPTRGSEIRKARPCVVVSPDELNDHLGTFLVAPMANLHRFWSRCARFAPYRLPPVVTVSPPPM